MVEALRRGASPKDATLEACRRVVATNKSPRLQDAKGRPNFDVKFYCVSKDGRFAGASLWAGAKLAMHDGDAAHLVDCASLYDEALVE
jgi:N4-(beta-N-acetylglucosaminyl)-L-asparaginase